MSNPLQIPLVAPVIIVGTGPAGLMAAHVVASHGHSVLIVEKRKGSGRKLLVAGSSGLNITFDAPVSEFAKFYTAPIGKMEMALKAFPPASWLEFIEGLGIGTFKGTSRRYFVEGMKASHLLRNWCSAIEKKGGVFFHQRELTGFRSEPATGEVVLTFGEGTEIRAKAACLCLGGGSWEKDENPLRWPEIFKKMGIAFREFRSSNCGFQVAWPEALLQEAEGQALKNVVLSSSRGSRSGELVITRYGLEGTPVYFAGEVETVHLDLKPDMSAEAIKSKLQSTRENLSPIRRVKKLLNLSEGALALIFHLTPKAMLGNLDDLVCRLKKFPIELKARQPLEEAISSSGGVEWSEVTDSLMLKKAPGIFLAGEMLDWDAPTGGFLIQGSVSQGFVAGMALVEYLNSESFRTRI
jgi:uncharacterized flavoprotein (TIGR03862 family)